MPYCQRYDTRKVFEATYDVRRIPFSVDRCRLFLILVANGLVDDGTHGFPRGVKQVPGC